MRQITIQTSARCQLIDITQKIIENITIGTGFCIIHVPHTTAAITINENADPDVKTDMLKTLEKLIPKDPTYRHSEGNSDAHLKSSLVGCSLQLIIKDGKPVLGTWQGIMFCEFDGPRQRKVLIECFGS